jgi:hypothetical protein
MLRTMLLASAVTFGLAVQADAEVVSFHAHMIAAQEIPSKTSNGQGDADAQLDTTTKALTYKVTWADLTGPATMAHFHGPAAAGANAGVMVPLGNTPTSPIEGSATLTDAQVKDFLDGKVYVNVHTAANPGGEIRGQMTRVKPKG